MKHYVRTRRGEEGAEADRTHLLWACLLGEPGQPKLEEVAGENNDFHKLKQNPQQARWVSTGDGDEGTSGLSSRLASYLRTCDGRERRSASKLETWRTSEVGRLSSPLK
eukprot:2568612-Rhodomonas_salina.2